MVFYSASVRLFMQQRALYEVLQCVCTVIAVPGQPEPGDLGGHYGRQEGGLRGRCPLLYEGGFRDDTATGE